MGNLSPDHFQMDSLWASAAAPADEIIHLNERSQ
jgi:hypothetical protein